MMRAIARELPANGLVLGFAVSRRLRHHAPRHGRTRRVITRGGCVRVAERLDARHDERALLRGQVADAEETRRSPASLSAAPP